MNPNVKITPRDLMFEIAPYMGIAATMSHVGWDNCSQRSPYRKKKDKAKIRKRKMAKMSRRRNR